MKKGFTLAEVLVVIAVAAIVGVIMVVIFTNTLRGSNKAQILSVIKQNGQSVLETMDKTIRNSDNVGCISGDILVVDKDGVYTRYKFIPSSNSSNGLFRQDSPVKGVAESNDQFITRVCLTYAPEPSVDDLTDTNSRTGVSVECPASDCVANPIFTRNKSAGFKDQVSVMFDLKPGVQAPQAVAGQIDPVTFQTTVQLR